MRVPDSFLVVGLGGLLLGVKEAQVCVTCGPAQFPMRASHLPCSRHSQPGSAEATHERNSGAASTEASDDHRSSTKWHGAAMGSQQALAHDGEHDMN